MPVRGKVLVQYASTTVGAALAETYNIWVLRAQVSFEPVPQHHLQTTQRNMRVISGTADMQPPSCPSGQASWPSPSPTASRAEGDGT
jgi:hypothetical protein